MDKSSRLLSLDVMRGMTIAGMILVNNPGTWSYIYAPLRHAEWHGLTPTDLVFPFFMFIMGVSTFLSLRKYDFRCSASSLVKIFRRAVLLLLVGWALGWISRTWSGLLNPDKTWVEAINNFANMRYMGVFTRLAICYFVTALLAVTISRKAMAAVCVAFLAIYTVMLLCGNGFEFSESNIITIVDNMMLGERHLYHDTVGGVTLAFDPEGLLSTIPSVAHCIIGFLCGGMIMREPDNFRRSYALFLVGTVLTMVGFLLDYGIPINKKIWSPTFVFVTCGLAALLLALLIYIIDIRQKRRWCTFFRVFGVNPLFLYVVATLLAIALIRIKVVTEITKNAKISLQTLIFENFLLPLCADNYFLASLVFALLFVITIWCIGYCLYRKKVFIKL